MKDVAVAPSSPLATVRDRPIDYAIITADESGTVTDWSTGAEALFGWTSAEMRAQPLTKIFAPEDLVYNAFGAGLEQDRFEGLDDDDRQHLHKDGSRFWARSEVRRLRGLSQPGFLAIVRDKTDASGALGDADAVPPRPIDGVDLHALLTNSETGFCVIEVEFDAAGAAVDYRFLDSNPAFENQTGLIGVVGRKASELASDLEHQWLELYGHVALTGEPVRFERVAEGGGRYYDVQARRIGDPDAHRVAILFNDISDQRRAELALQRSEEHWRGVFEHLHEGIVLGEVVREAGIVVDWRYVDVNDAWRELVGVSGDVKGRTVRNLFPGIEDIWIDEIATVVETGTSATFTRTVGALGRWYEARAHRVGAERFALLFNEITSNRSAEERRIALLELGDRTRDLQDPTEMSAVAAEIIGRTLLVERAGYGSFAEDGRTVIVESDWVPPGSPSAVGHHDLRTLGTFLDDLERGEIVAIADTHRDYRTSGHTAAFERLQIKALLNFPIIENGRLVAVLFANSSAPRVWTREEIAFAGEVGERMRSAIERRRAESTLRALNASLEQAVALQTNALTETEEQLRQSQKMGAVGQLTGGLAHDFNNLLTGISGSLGIVQHQMAQGRMSEVERYVATAQTSAQRAAALTHRLLAFSRQQALLPVSTDINRLVSDFEEMVRRTVGPQIALNVVAASDLWCTFVDPNQLENALLNLCINARDAMPDGGTLTIETANRWLDEHAAQERDVPPGPYIALSVTDNGTGMLPEVIERAFDPFFTTKPVGHGTGLGLSMIHGFARQSGGQVRIYSELGQGTTICLYLPRDQGAAAPSFPDVEADVEAARAEAGETILVVDDNPIILALVIDTLTELGYVAIGAKDGPSGLEILQSDVRIDLLISDVGLPAGMNGRQLANAARHMRPDLHVLFITGYAENAAVVVGDLDAEMQVLTKPFTMHALGGRVRQLIH